MSFLRCFQWRRTVVLFSVIGLFLVIPLNTAFAQDPESTEQENNDRLLVASAIILVIAAYTAVFVGEDADSRGKDGFQWGVIFFIVVSTGPLIYYVLAKRNDDDKILTGVGIFLAELCLALGVYYLVLRPGRSRLTKI